MRPSETEPDFTTSNPTSLDMGESDEMQKQYDISSLLPTSKQTKALIQQEIEQEVEGEIEQKVEQELVKVLLIDDQPIIAESIRRLLASEPNIKLFYCNDPRQAIPQSLKIAPTVILQDLVMPDVDGLMMVKFFRANPVTRLIPIIVLSNREESIVKAEAFSLGANDYLVKIPDPIELIARLQYHSMAYRDRCKVIHHSHELEERVAERTAELEATLVHLKQTQAQLVQDEKMASLGQLVAGVAHEINNPVNFIAGNLEPAQDYAQDLLHLISLYQQEYPQPRKIIQTEIEDLDLDFLVDDFPKLLGSLKLGTDRIKAIVRSLRNFARTDETMMQFVDICDGIDSTLIILGSKLKFVEVNRAYRDRPVVECLAGKLNQVFMNILANAADALEDKVNRCKQEGNFEESDYRPKIHICSEILDNNWVRVTIADNGLGIPEEIRDRLFEPFFTTKSVGKGTGLGLSISHQIIVEKHGGKIEMFSNEEGGTTFAIEIPLQPHEI